MGEVVEKGKGSRNTAVGKCEGMARRGKTRKGENSGGEKGEKGKKWDERKKE